MPCFISDFFVLIFATPTASNTSIAIANASGEVRSNAPPLCPAKLAFVREVDFTLVSRKMSNTILINACSATNLR